MMKGRGRLVPAVAMLMIVLAGCTASPALTKPTLPVESPTEVVPTPEVTADLAAMKKAAGIADCPRSDPDAEALSSGLRSG